MAKKFENKDFFAGDLFSKTIEDAKSLLKVLDQIEAQVKEFAATQKKALSGNKLNNVKQINKATRAQKTLNEAEKVSQKIAKEKQNLQTRLKAANSDRIQQNERLKVQFQEQNRINKDLARESLRKTNAYAAESARLRRLVREYQHLAASGKANTAQSRKLLAEITKLDAKLKQIDKTVGRNQRNVGNYASAFGGLRRAAMSAFTALGFAGGVYAIVNAFRDAAQRVVEFDKVMQNLAGILGVNREDISALEEQIKLVAGTSIKTSNEVAKLAETLITLGKTPREVRKLLKPTNDLSIALQASSDEAGELLVSTLNAFGESSDEAERYANVIAKMRTSTALNFERIQVSLGYLAPVAKAVGLEIEETGALIGVLVDNGIRAQRAGRLLASSFGRLAQNGMTLEEALDQVRNSTDRVATATSIFGAEAFALGLILAENKDTLEETTKEIRDSESALDDLVNQQLKSMSAEIKILDSAWERFILSIENGEGPISKTFAAITRSLATFTTQLTILNTTVKEFGDQAEGDLTDEIVKIITGAENSEEIVKRLNRELINTRKELSKVTKIRSEADQDKSMWDWLSPEDKALQEGVDKGFDEVEGRLRKRIALLQKALENPFDFIEEPPPPSAPPGETSRRGEIDLLNRDFDTDLDKLKERLELIDSARERLVTKTDQPSVLKFEELTAERKELEMIISIYEEMLEGEKELQKEVKKGLMTNDQLWDDYWKKRQKQIEEEMRLERERQELIRDGISAIASLVDAQFDQSLNRINDQLVRLEGRAISLREKAAQGNLAAEQSLAEEEKKRAELEKKREKARKQQQQSQAFFTVLETYQSKVAAGDPSPLTSTIRDVAVLRGIAQSLGSFYEGTDDLGKEKKPMDSKGGRLIVAHDNEQIWSKKDRDAVGWRNRDEIKEIVQMHDSGIMGKIMGYDSAELKQASVNIDNRKLEQKLEKVNRSIQGIKIPEGTVSIDGVRKLINVKMRKGNKVTTERSRLHD